MKEAGLILLQTIPEHIDIDEVRRDFEKAFPDIANIHDLHVWRLNQSKVFCTAHVRFRDARDYLRVNQDVSSFFLKYGVTQVTVQPEFCGEGQDLGPHGNACLMRCPGESCLRAHCCAPMSPTSAHHEHHDHHDHHHQHYVRVASDLSLPERPPACVVDRVQVVVEVNAEAVQETSLTTEVEDAVEAADTAPSTPTTARREVVDGEPADKDKSKQD